MIATFTRNQMQAAHDIMSSFHSILRYGVVNINNREVFVVESGPMAAILEIRVRLSDKQDLEALKA